MIRRYHCQKCRRRRNFYHVPKMDDYSGPNPDQIVRYFRCSDCGFLYTIMAYAAADRLGETRWATDRDQVFKEVVGQSVKRPHL